MESLIDVMKTTAPGAIVEYHSPAWVIPATTLVTGDDSRLEVGKEAAQAVLSSHSCTPRLAFLQLGQALILVHRNDAKSAERDYSYLLAFSEVMPEGEPLCQVGSCVIRTLGLLSHTMGDLDQAVEHFEDSLSFCRPAGFQPELAWTSRDYAETLSKRDNEGDRAKAVSLLDESLTISTELSMRPLMERVLNRQEILYRRMVVKGVYNRILTVSIVPLRICNPSQPEPQINGKRIV